MAAQTPQGTLSFNPLPRRAHFKPRHNRRRRGHRGQKSIPPHRIPREGTRGSSSVSPRVCQEDRRAGARHNAGDRARAGVLRLGSRGWDDAGAAGVQPRHHPASHAAGFSRALALARRLYLCPCIHEAVESRSHARREREIERERESERESERETNTRKHTHAHTHEQAHRQQLVESTEEAWQTLRESLRPVLSPHLLEDHGESARKRERESANAARVRPRPRARESERRRRDRGVVGRGESV
jgi:hypothetical protein